MEVQHPGQAPRSCRIMPAMNDERDDASEEQPGMGFSEAIDLVDLVGVLGHVGKRCIVLIERSDLGDTDTADGVFDLSLQPDLLGALQIARHKRDFAAHLTGSCETIQAR